MNGIFKAAKILIVPAYLGEAPKLERLNWGGNCIQDVFSFKLGQCRIFGREGRGGGEDLKKKRKKSILQNNWIAFLCVTMLGTTPFCFVTFSGQPDQILCPLKGD